MLDGVRRQILAILRVPSEPQLPEGTPGSVLVFRAGRNFYRRQVLAWAFSHLGAVAGAMAAYYFTWRLVALGPFWVRALYGVVEIFALLAIAVGLPFTFLALRWDYELRWYIVTDCSLRIRRGVWNVEELTMTFANIQEIRVTSGPIQHFLGLADVEVHSAGGGGAGPHSERSAHVAYFEGVDNAAAIRDLMVERLRVFRETGLGSEHQEPAALQAPDATLSAIRAVLEEARELRTVWIGSPTSVLRGAQRSYDPGA